MASFLQHHINNLLTFVFPDECLEEMFFKLDILHPRCTSIAISRGLGLGITTASLLLFVPQIVKIHLARSGKGISLASQMFGLLACFGTLAYSYANNFVFSQWGDSLFIFVQMGIVITQILYFNSRLNMVIVFLAAYSSAILAVVCGYIPMNVLTMLQASTIFVVGISKFFQIWESYKNASTGELSMVSVALQFLGCLARIFTSVKETGDMLVIVSYIVASVLNGIVFSQFFIYWNADKEKKRV